MATATKKKAAAPRSRQSRVKATAPGVNDNITAANEELARLRAENAKLLKANGEEVPAAAAPGDAWDSVEAENDRLKQEVEALRGQLRQAPRVGDQQAATTRFVSLGNMCLGAFADAHGLDVATLVRFNRRALDAAAIARGIATPNHTAGSQYDGTLVEVPLDTEGPQVVADAPAEAHPTL